MLFHTHFNCVYRNKSIRTQLAFVCFFLHPVIKYDYNLSTLFMNKQR